MFTCSSFNNGQGKNGREGKIERDRQRENITLGWSYLTIGWARGFVRYLHSRLFFAL
jgi:hypothetical protein